MRSLKLLLIFVSLTVNTILAQANPIVEVILSQPKASQGDTIRADLYVRDGVNVGGIDIGIIADETCLRILERQPGDYLPTTDAEGAFSAFSELNEHNTRLASALTDRTKYVNGDGVFYTVQLEVICDEGNAPLAISYAQVSSYIDPSAEIIDVVSYDLDEGTLTTSNAMLEIIAGDQLTAEPTLTIAAVIQSTTESDESTTATIAPTNTTEPTKQATAIATGTVETSPKTTQPDDSSPSQVIWMVALILVAVGVIGLIILFLIDRRRRSRER